MPVYIIRKKAKSHEVKINFTGRSYKNVEPQQVSDILTIRNWNDFANNDIDTCWDIMYTNIMAATNTLCPLKEFKFSKDKPIWLTHDLIVLMKNRDNCLRKYTKTKKETDKFKMRKARNLTNIAVKLLEQIISKSNLNLIVMILNNSGKI